MKEKGRRKGKGGTNPSDGMSPEELQRLMDQTMGSQQPKQGKPEPVESGLLLSILKKVWKYVKKAASWSKDKVVEGWGWLKPKLEPVLAPIRKHVTDPIKERFWDPYVQPKLNVVSEWGKGVWKSSIQAPKDVWYGRLKSACDVGAGLSAVVATITAVICIAFVIYFSIQGAWVGALLAGLIGTGVTGISGMAAFSLTNAAESWEDKELTARIRVYRGEGEEVEQQMGRGRAPGPKGPQDPVLGQQGTNQILQDPESYIGPQGTHPLQGALQQLEKEEQQRKMEHGHFPVRATKDAGL